MRYRKLEMGELIQEGDEYQRKDGTWREVGFTGMKVLLTKHRRPISAEQAANMFRQKMAGLMEECGVIDIFYGYATQGQVVSMREGPVFKLCDGKDISPESIRESITSPTQVATKNP